MPRLASSRATGKCVRGGRGDDGGVDMAGQVEEIGPRASARLGGHGLAGLGVRIGHPHQLAIGQLTGQSGMDPAQMAHADHAQTQRAWTAAAGARVGQADNGPGR